MNSHRFVPSSSCYSAILRATVGGREVEVGFFWRVNREQGIARMRSVKRRPREGLTLSNGVCILSQGLTDRHTCIGPRDGSNNTISTPLPMLSPQSSSTPDSLVVVLTGRLRVANHAHHVHNYGEDCRCITRIHNFNRVAWQSGGMRRGGGFG